MKASSFRAPAWRQQESVNDHSVPMVSDQEFVVEASRCQDLDGWDSISSVFCFVLGSIAPSLSLRRFTKTGLTGEAPIHLISIHLFSFASLSITWSAVDLPILSCRFIGAFLCLISQ